jgi:hypothetical protein
VFLAFPDNYSIFMDENPYQPPHDQSPAVPGELHSREPFSLTAPNLFGVVVRSMGLALTVQNAWTALGAIRPQQGLAVEDYILGSGIGLGFGIVLLFGADKIVQFVYGHGSRRAEDVSSGDEKRP